MPVRIAATAMYRAVHSTREVMMPIGTSRFGLRASSACVDTEVGEEDDRRPRQHPERLPAHSRLSEDGLSEEGDAGQPIGRERLPVRGIDVERPDRDDEEDDHQLDAHHEGVEAGALPYA